MSDWKITTLAWDCEKEWAPVGVETVAMGASLRLPLGRAMLIIEPTENESARNCNEH